MLERSVPLVSLRKALVPPWFKEMEPRYRDSRVARNSALSTRYLAAFAAICLVSTIVLSIGSLTNARSTFRRCDHASDLYLSRQLLRLRIACDYWRNRGYVAIQHTHSCKVSVVVDWTATAL